MLHFTLFLLVFKGAVDRFLSSKPLVLVSRLSYAIYLVNVNLFNVYVSHLRIPFYVTRLNLLMNAISMTTLNLVVSFVLVVVIEMPFRKLGRILSSKRVATSAVDELKNHPEKPRNSNSSNVK